MIHRQGITGLAGRGLARAARGEIVLGALDEDDLLVGRAGPFVVDLGRHDQAEAA